MAGRDWLDRSATESLKVTVRARCVSAENLVPAFVLLFGSIRQEPDHGVHGSRCVPLPHHSHPLRESTPR